MGHQLVLDHFQPVTDRLVQIHWLHIANRLTAFDKISHPLDNPLDPVGISRNQSQRLHDAFGVEGLFLFKPVDNAVGRQFDGLQRLV